MTDAPVIEGLDALETLARKVRQIVATCDTTDEDRKVDIGVYLDHVEGGARQLERELVEQLIREEEAA